MRIEAKKMRQHIVAATPKAFFHSAPEWEIVFQYFKNITFVYLQWCQLESLQVLFYEAKVPTSDGYITF